MADVRVLITEAPITIYYMGPASEESCTLTQDAPDFPGSTWASRSGLEPNFGLQSRAFSVCGHPEGP
jgi:hypothetical protein